MAARAHRSEVAGDSDRSPGPLITCLAVTIQVPAAVRLATVGRLPQAGLSSWAGEPVPGLSGLVGQRRYGLDAAAGSQGRPANRSRSTARACWPFLRAVDRLGADREERPGTGLRPPAAGDLLLQFDHPHVALGLVVVEGHPEVAGEAQHVVAVTVQPGQQRGGRAELGPAALAGPRWRRVEPLALDDQRVVAVPDGPS